MKLLNKFVFDIISKIKDLYEFDEFVLTSGYPSTSYNFNTFLIGMRVHSFFRFDPDHYQNITVYNRFVGKIVLHVFFPVDEYHNTQSSGYVFIEFLDLVPVRFALFEVEATNVLVSNCLLKYQELFTDIDNLPIGSLEGFLKVLNTDHYLYVYSSGNYAFKYDSNIISSFDAFVNEKLQYLERIGSIKFVSEVKSHLPFSISILLGFNNRNSISKISEIEYFSNYQITLNSGVIVNVAVVSFCSKIFIVIDEKYAYVSYNEGRNFELFSKDPNFEIIDSLKKFEFYEFCNVFERLIEIILK